MSSHRDNPYPAGGVLVAAQVWEPTRPPGVLRHSGTNGWLSSWGTNAHGEIAGCPPGVGLRAQER